MSSDFDVPTTRDAIVNLRLQASARNLIDLAAAAQGETRTEFMVEAARREAENVLLDRCFFSLSEDAFADFVAMLDQPSAKNVRLQKLLKTAPPRES